MDLRVKKARWYLDNTAEKITNIAFNTGFSNTTTFNRVFKELTGFTPSEYRRSKNNGEET
jgi:transcriptional regulator GlxA family with amidase domain